MGANHPGEIKFLCEIAEPDYGIITNVGKAHLEGFGSFEGVIKTKGELYDFLRKKDAITFIHHDNAYLMNIAQGLNLISYGTEDDLYVNGQITDNSPYLAFEWKAGKDGERHQVRTQLIGEYNFPKPWLPSLSDVSSEWKRRRLMRLWQAIRHRTIAPNLKRQKITRLSSMHIMQIQPA